ncbi:hypothetical protein CMI37_23305 [Candidatus Pacearchaeota archaeon]|nr:hypothetical protein [Candidatus Pacearchaeota archaeon]
MTEKKLSTGKKVLIKDLGEDKIVDLKDIMEFVSYPNGSSTIKNVNKHRLAWLREGLVGLGDWKAKNGEIVEDQLLKTLTEEEKDEVFKLIQEAQVLSPNKPLSLDSMS